MCVLIYLQIMSETFLILRRIEPDRSKKCIGLHVKLFFSDINKTEFLERFSKILNYEFHENPSGWSRVVPCGWTDRRTDIHEEANSRFSEFCERT